jgi:hypothetical protein
VTSRPAPLHLTVCVLVLLEAALFVGLGVALVADLVGGNTDTVGVTVFLALFALAIGALLGWCARGLWRGRRWSRSPVITWQIILLILGVSSAAGGVTLVSLGLVALATAILIGLFVPTVHAATSGRTEPDGQS